MCITDAFRKSFVRSVKNQKAEKVFDFKTFSAFFCYE